MRPIEEYLADHILTHCRGDAFKDLRRRTLAFWREHYGVDVAKKVELMVKAKWKVK